MRPARKTLRRPDDLVSAGLLPPERRAEIEAVAARYALALTSDIAELIDPTDPHDPLARQFVPDPAELEGARHRVMGTNPSITELGLESEWNGRECGCALRALSIFCIRQHYWAGRWCQARRMI